MSDERYVLVPVTITDGIFHAMEQTDHPNNHAAYFCDLWTNAVSAAPPPDDAVTERVARGLCEQHYRIALFDTHPDEMEAVIATEVEAAWAAFVGPATAAIAALCGGRVDG